MYAMLCVCKIHRYTNCFNYKSLKNYKFNLFRNDRLFGVIFNCLKKFVLVEMIRKTMMCVMYPVASNNTEDPLVTISLQYLYSCVPCSFSYILLIFGLVFAFNQSCHA